MANNLVQNSDFSSEYEFWTLEGMTHNAQIVDEPGAKMFSRFGPDVTMYQDVRVEPGRQHTFTFRFQAPWMGNGIHVRVKGLEADGQPTQTLAEEVIGQTSSWTDKSILFNSAQFQTIRLRFDIFSAADIANVNLVAP